MIEGAPETNKLYVNESDRQKDFYLLTRYYDIMVAAQVQKAFSHISIGIILCVNKLYILKPNVFITCV